jgi:signal transduction histidine kinase
VCEQIRKTPNGRDVPFVFLSALRDVDTFDRALSAGGDDFLTKPIHPAELVARVQAALKLQALRRERREQYDVLKQQRDALQRLQLQKERLAAFVVHDLKNPVNSIALYAQLLLRSKEIAEPLRHSALRIYTEAAQLGRMILNLLDVSKADEGKLSVNVAEVALGPLIHEAFADVELAAQSRQVALQSTIEAPRIQADEALFRRVLVNILENALRHAPAESTIHVQTVSVDDGVELRVSDQGSGIPEEIRTQIFEPYFQVHAEDQHLTRGGRGLGLTFCKLAVEAHVGHIWVEDAAPGAVFCLRLPHER